MRITQQEYNQLLFGGSLLIEKQIKLNKKVTVSCKGLANLNTICVQWFGYVDNYNSVLRLKA